MRWALQHIDHPSEEPVTLQEAKAHLRVDDPEQDQWITEAIAAAREFCETFQGRAYVTQRLALSLERWPCGRSIYLPRPPLQSVEAVTYTLADGTVQTFDSALYVVDTAAEPGAIHLRPSVSWPAEHLGAGLPVRVEFTAGYGTASAVPLRAVQAILLLVGHWYESRETVVVGMISRELEFTVQALLWQERAWYAGPDGGGP